MVMQKSRFKYRFYPQPLVFVSNWSSTFQPCVKMVIFVKCWMENTNTTNDLFLILKMSDVACQFKLKKKKKNSEYSFFYLNF